MKKERRLIILEIIFGLIVLVAMFFNDYINRQIFAIVLLIYMLFNKLLLKNGKITYSISRKISILLIIMGSIYVAFLYFLGLFTGFYYSTVQLSLWSVFNYIIPYAAIIISTEIIRKNILLKENKISKYVVLAIMVILDIVLSTNIYNLKTVNDYFTLISFIIISSIANNMFFYYIIIKYRSSIGIIIYRLITTLYMYILPITPNIYIFLESVIRIIVPYILYVIIETLYNKKNEIISIKQRQKNTISFIVCCIIIIVIVMLISCQFKYGVLVVGSESMTGTIDKGDLVLYERYNEEEQINVGDIIVFQEDDTKIIHRIIEKRFNGKNTIYYTQGDANLNRDDGYRLYDEIIGKVKLKLPYVGYFTLWINDLLKGE